MESDILLSINQFSSGAFIWWQRVHLNGLIELWQQLVYHRQSSQRAGEQVYKVSLSPCSNILRLGNDSGWLMCYSVSVFLDLQLLICGPDVMMMSADWACVCSLSPQAWWDGDGERGGEGELWGHQESSDGSAGEPDHTFQVWTSHRFTTKIWWKPVGFTSVRCGNSNTFITILVLVLLLRYLTSGWADL